jgi:hypothetical protein
MNKEAISSSSSDPTESIERGHSSIPNVTNVSNAVNNWKRNGFGQAIDPTIGKFSVAESQTVKAAIEDFCNSHGVTPSRLCSDSDNRTDHLRGAWMEIAQQLPSRTVQSIYRHGLRLMHPFKRGAWSEEETKELLLLVTKHGKKWSEIQSSLNRSADSCRDKHREFHADYTKGKWGVEESRELETYVRIELKVGPEVSLEDLGRLGDQDSANIPWSAISQKMKNRSRLSCFKRFQLVTGLKKAMAANSTASNTGKKRQRSAVTAYPVGESNLDVAVTANANTVAPIVTQDPIYVNVDQAASMPEFDSIETEDPKSVQPFSDVPDVTTAYDRQILHHLATSSFTQESEVNWTAVRYPYGDPKVRYEQILDKWIEAYGVDEDEVMDRPLWEVAKEIMNQEEDLTGSVEEDQAELAARTVEAVFLC